MSRMKVMTIIGTRPELIKLSRVLAELDAHTDHILVHSGQNYDYELNEIFFKELEIRTPDHFLEAVGGSVAETIGLVISRADAVMEKESPDAILFYGDTNTCLAVIAAKRRKIPVFHMEAGNRCFDQRVPEELNRKIIDHLSDINMPLTEHARSYLLREGLQPETIIKTGSPLREVLNYYRPSIEASSILKELDLTAQDYFLFSTHREENVDDAENLSNLLTTLNALVDTYQKPIVVSTHPRTRKRLTELDTSQMEKMSPAVRFLKPFGFFDYVHLEMNAFCVLSDSGTITEEAAILGFPAVTVRNTHERPEGMDEGVVVMSGLKKEAVLRAVECVTAQHQAGKGCIRSVPDYEADNVSIKVTRIILSYVDYVNRTVWQKD